MPIYEYTCKDCQHQFEVIQKLSDLPVKQCPQCLGMRAEKMISSAGFQLKGSGWYATDFKNPPSTKKSPEKNTTQSDKSSKD